MAFIDDPEFVIAHIRHSCVVTDDTGELCTDHFEASTFFLGDSRGVSRKHRPRKRRPQTADLENTDLENTDLENTDLENADLENTDYN